MKQRFLERVYTLALVVVLIAFPLASRAQGSASPGISVYNAQHVSLTKAWADAYTAETGIPVTLRNGGDTAFANQIVQEGAASSADVFLTENSPAMALVDQAGLFAPLNADVLAQVPDIQALRRPLDRHRGAQHRIRVQQGQTDPGPAAEINRGSGKPELERTLGRVARGCRLPGDRQRDAGTQGRSRDARLAEGDEGERNRLQG